MNQSEIVLEDQYVLKGLKIKFSASTIGRDLFYPYRERMIPK